MLHIISARCVALWFAHDCTQVTWMSVFETVWDAVRRLWKSRIAPSSAVVISIISSSSKYHTDASGIGIHVSSWGLWIWHEASTLTLPHLFQKTQEAASADGLSTCCSQPVACSKRQDQCASVSHYSQPGTQFSRPHLSPPTGGGRAWLNCASCCWRWSCLTERCVLLLEVVVLDWTVRPVAGGGRAWLNGVSCCWRWSCLTERCVLLLCWESERPQVVRRRERGGVLQVRMCCTHFFLLVQRGIPGDLLWCLVCECAAWRIRSCCFCTVLVTLCLDCMEGGSSVWKTAVVWKFCKDLYKYL